MPARSHLVDKTIEKGTCLACGAPLAGRPATVTVVVRTGSARETTWITCRCGAICRSERVRHVSYLQSRMPDAHV